MWRPLFLSSSLLTRPLSPPPQGGVRYEPEYETGDDDDLHVVGIRNHLRYAGIGHDDQIAVPHGKTLLHPAHVCHHDDYDAFEFAGHDS
ncbi:hypothetical protein THAR02_04408 [Trichoderma harzianum]|uniref:Uncharacterized protein n=1 Tax=Trichoderma harzianum TaxID=5544 RepID=A0A0F9XTP6_TRIHA|nr:hypothetical protein THAR02_04408 [Trichoderma harzianum]